MKGFAGMDVLPCFIVIGAMRAGTTTLYNRLERHPEIGMSTQKEADYFVEGLNWSHGLAWYKAQFRHGHRVYGDVSPNYAKRRDFPGVPERIAALIPSCKLIYILRDPVERAISHYTHSFLSGQRLIKPRRMRPGAHDFEHIVDASRYHWQISAYLDHFPKEQIHIIDFDELTGSPAAVLTQLAGILGVADTWPSSTDTEANTSGYLARLPKWYFSARSMPAVSALKNRLPRWATNLAKSTLASGPPRVAPTLDEEVRARIADAVADDANALRAATGRAFAQWSV